MCVFISLWATMAYRASPPIRAVPRWYGFVGRKVRIMNQDVKLKSGPPFGAISLKNV